MYSYSARETNPEEFIAEAVLSNARFAVFKELRIIILLFWVSAPCILVGRHQS
jgi:lipoate-protein ligase A